ncbi:MAG: tail fiber domain-containing protein, partial [Akkermansiaceae bacterium]|nr:tail fiber domain-containing protein [Akkermansiaceae bacterium]
DVWGTTFYETSDRNLKEKFEDVDPMEVLDQVATMPITTWKFKEDDSAVRHIGPMAQDFHQAFGLGLDDRHISTTDADGVALAAIQALKQLLDDKDRKIQDLEARLQKLEKSSQKNR